MALIAAGPSYPPPPPASTPNTRGDGPESLPTESVRRLQDARQVVTLLRGVESTDGIRAWFLGKNPILDDVPPALALASDPEAVVRAARAFAFHG